MNQPFQLISLDKKDYQISGFDSEFGALMSITSQFNPLFTNENYIFNKTKRIFKKFDKTDGRFKKVKISREREKMNKP